MWSNPKTPEIRNKAWLRFVADLPCILCAIEGASQSAHMHKRGHKIKGKKANDNQVVPLCHEGANGCHAKVDRYEIKPDVDSLIHKANMAYEFWLKGNKDDARRILR